MKNPCFSHKHNFLKQMFPKVRKKLYFPSFWHKHNFLKEIDNGIKKVEKPKFDLIKANLGSPKRVPVEKLNFKV